MRIARTKLYAIYRASACQIAWFVLVFMMLILTATSFTTQTAAVMENCPNIVTNYYVNIRCCQATLQKKSIFERYLLTPKCSYILFQPEIKMDICIYSIVDNEDSSIAKRHRQYPIKRHIHPSHQWSDRMKVISCLQGSRRTGCCLMLVPIESQCYLWRLLILL